ncbi:MAG: hypothetical protein GW856_01240 [Cyanobacteria bacterium]|nr:hypothetical protein [Cyanobacteria bacterium CG_2015-16_32_12]NCO78006.1 hypothetical protein [Cyanobacteria bacterium CG_2015-22_32_23]NCQ03255.1 hypothetical protein [Cyanobacteria bacterium CG_2015-09_32_10]NCS85502.1 hypothetical protein [Cyanobacteria bacterium CG_2015-02_32_10]
MIDSSYFSLGILLWLISSGFLVTLTDSDSSAKAKKKPESKLIDHNIPQDNQDNIEKIKELEAKLQEKVVELTLNQEKITALEEELQITGDQLELTQDKYFQREKEFQIQCNNLENTIKILENKTANLTQEIENLPSQLITNWQQESFDLLQTLLANYPTAKIMVKLKPDLSANHLITLLKPLDKLLTQWNIESIGKPWEKVFFNPEIHYSDEDDIIANDLVYIRFIGYAQKNALNYHILLKAKVSRTLPQSNKHN